jgi:hypothetical protein
MVFPNWPCRKGFVVTMTCSLGDVQGPNRIVQDWVSNGKFSTVNVQMCRTM